MIDYLPPEITIASFSIIGILSGYIWNSQAKKISDIKNIQQQCPINRVSNSIARIETDIKWIVTTLNNNQNQNERFDRMGR